MAFDTFAEFLVMTWNGRAHGPFVWAAYGLTFTVVVWNIVQPVVRRRRWQREQLAQLKRDARDGHQP